MLLQAQPGAKRQALELRDGVLKAYVTAAPEKGKANKAILELLSKRLKLRKSQLQYLAGETSRQKKVLVCGITVEKMQEMLQSL